MLHLTQAAFRSRYWANVCTRLQNFDAKFKVSDLKAVCTNNESTVRQRHQCLRTLRVAERSPALVPITAVSFHTSASMSAPDVLRLEATSHALRVGLLAPETPFLDGETGQYIRMDDKNLPGVSKVYYNYTLWEVPQGSTSTAQWILVKNK